MEKLDPDQIYDPNMSNTVPKVKQVFRISKDHHMNMSCRSSHGSSRFTSPLLGATTPNYSALSNLGSVGEHQIDIGDSMQ